MANSTINQLEYHGTLYDVEDTAARTGLETKADKSTTYTKTEVDTALSDKADKTDIPTTLAELTGDSTHRVVTDTEKSTWDNKVDKVQGKGLSTNDYTTAEKTKLAGIAEGAEVNVQPDWNQTTTTADDYIKNKPSIPTVNDSTITIQKNGVAVDSFTTNAATGKTINITVPTTAAEVDALPDTTKYAAAVNLSIDPSTFVVTIQLIDQNGDNLGQAQTIDLPLESVVVSGRYDSQTKKVILTLQSGSTVEFSVADLVAGLQSEITANNPLSSDLVDDTNATHKFVSASEKNTWNSKQDTISDLSTIRSGASAGATAVQPAALNDYATTTAMNTALGGKQDALSQAQMAAVNSGATQAKIGQIETNKNNILLVESLNGAKNYAQINNGSELAVIKIPCTISAGEYYVYIGNLQSTESTGSSRINFVDSSGNTVSDVYYAERKANIWRKFTVTAITTELWIYASSTYQGSQTVTVTDVMVISNSQYNAGFTSYQPYSIPNTIITPELIELVDSGAKNELSLSLAEMQSINTGQGVSWSGNVCTIAGITFTVNDDMTITVNGTLTGERALFRIFYNRANIWGGKILSGCPQNGSNMTYGINLEQVTTPWASIAQDYGSGSKIIENTTVNIYGYIVVKQSVNNLTFKPMICTKAAWDVSQKYVPYRPSYEDLSEQVETNKNNISSLSGSVSSLANRGAKNAYRITNVPTVSGVTITQIDESSASLVGTFSGNTYVFFNLSGNNFILPKGDWIVSYIFDGTSLYSRKLILSTNDGDLQIDPNTEVEFTTTADRNISAYINYFTGETINATIRIMIRPAEIADDSYVPYAPTNAELYEMIQALQSGRSLQSTAPTMIAESLDKTELANVDDKLISIDEPFSKE